MRLRKWLIVILSLTILVNIFIYFINKNIGLDEIYKRVFQTYLSKNLNLDIVLDEVKLNDKHINFHNVFIKNEFYNINIEDVFVEYNLFKFLTFRFKRENFLKSVKVYNPKGEIEIGKGGKPKLYSIINTIGKVDIINGEFLISFLNDNIFLIDTLNSFQATVELKKEKIILESVSSLSGKKNNSKLLISLDKNDKLDSLYIFLDSYFVKNPLKENSVNSIVGGTFTQNSLKEFKIDLDLKDIKAEIGENTFSTDSLRLFGDNKEILLSTNNSFLNEIPIKFTTVIKNPQKNRVELFADTIFVGNQLFKKLHLQVKKRQKTAEILNLVWDKNDLKGNIERVKNLYHYEIKSENFTYQQKGENYFLNGNIFSKGKTDLKKIDGELFIDSLYFKNQFLKLSNFLLSAKLNQKMDLELFLKNDKITANGKINLLEKSLDFYISTKNIFLSDIFTEIPDTLPSISFDLFGYYFNKDIFFSADVDLAKNSKFPINGTFLTTVEYNLNNSFLSLSSKSKKFYYKDKDIAFNFEALGKRDSIRTNFFSINNEIFSEFYLYFDKKWNYELFLKGSQLELKNYSDYFFNKYISSNIYGKFDLDLQYFTNSQKQNMAKIYLNDFRFNNIGFLDAELVFEGDLNRAEIKKSIIKQSNDTVALLNGVINPKLLGFVDISLKEYDIEKLMVENDDSLSGKIFGEALYKNDSTPTLKVNIGGKNLFFYDFIINEFKIDFEQKTTSLKVNELSARANHRHTILAEGDLSYNFITQNKYENDEQLRLYYDGDFLEILNNFYNIFEYENSFSRFYLFLTMKESGIHIKNGAVILNKGEALIKHQLKPIEDMEVYINIHNDSIIIKKFDGKIKKDKFFITNQIYNNEFDIKIANLNFGRVFLTTSNKGIELFYPGYMTPKNSSKVIFKGRDSDKFEFIGPLNNFVIKGDLYFSKGRGLFPKNSKNLFSIITKEEKRIKPVYPFTLDLKLIMGENNFYATYPLNVAIDEGGFLKLNYADGVWSVPEAIFSSQRGTVELFGTTFKAKNINVQISKQRQIAKVHGEFEKYAYDGSVATYTIFNENETNLRFLDNLNTKLTSSNKALKTDLDILYSIRKYSPTSQIEPTQMYELVQDQAVMLFGNTFQDVIFEPFISPLENALVNAFDLEYIIIRFWLIQNVFSQYSSLEVEKNESNNNNFTNYLLNNMNILLGKSLLRNLFFETEILFQEPTEFAEKKDFLIYQDIGLRYILPKNYILQYKLKALDPTKEISHEFIIGKSFSF